MVAVTAFTAPQHPIRFGGDDKPGKTPDPVNPDWDPSQPLLSIRNLSVGLPHSPQALIIRDLSLDVKAGEVLCLVGESGCGKSTVLNAIEGISPLGYEPPRESLTSRMLKKVGLKKKNPDDGKATERMLIGGLMIRDGKILYKGKDLLQMPDQVMNDQIRGDEIAMIFQDPTESLNPLKRIWQQIIERPQIYGRIKSGEELRKRAQELLLEVGIKADDATLNKYPHEFSGGQKQRVMIAMTRACNPSLILADEPTTALDPSIQAGVLRQFKEVVKMSGASVIFVTHNLGVVQEIADRVGVMYAGRLVEVAPNDVFFKTKTVKHPYAHALNMAMPRKGMKLEDLKELGGLPPKPGQMPKGCAFSDRCSPSKKFEASQDPVDQAKRKKCREENPELQEVSPEHHVACHHILEFLKRMEDLDKASPPPSFKIPDPAAPPEGKPPKPEKPKP